MNLSEIIPTGAYRNFVLLCKAKGLPDLGPMYNSSSYQLAHNKKIVRKRALFYTHMYCYVYTYTLTKIIV